MGKKMIAIVTGASSGLGREFVRKLAEQNDLQEIWAVARNEKRLDALVTDFGSKIKTFSMDLSEMETIQKIEKRMREEKVTVSVLINNAGYAKFCSYDDISVEESLNMIDLNIKGVVAMGLVCIPYMPRGGHILNIASQASFQPLPYQNIYSSTKAFVRNYSRALNVELKDRGIVVTAVCPGWMKTGLIERGLIGAGKATNNFFGMVSPDVVAEKALKDAFRGKDISVYSLLVKMCHLIAKVVPQRAMMRAWLMQQKIKPSNNGRS